MLVFRRFVLLVAVALAAVAMTATTASAQETEIEVINEETGNPCAPCDVHIEGESHIRAMPSGVIVSSCHDELFLTVNHNGSGELEWVGSQHGAPGCNTVNCVADEGHWPLSGFGEEDNGTEHVTYRFCLRNPSTGQELHCDGRVRMADTTGDHHYEFTTSPPSGIVCAGGARIWELHWETENPHNPGEGDDEMQIVHHVN